jgi:hypothetical protein
VVPRFRVILTLVFIALLLPSGYCLAAVTTIANGIRISELPPDGDRFEVILGYQAGVRNETTGLSGLASIVSHYLASSPAARSISLAAYGAGGEVEFLDDLDRTALRVSVPAWAKPMILAQMAPYFAEAPGQDADLLARARLAVLQAATTRNLPFHSEVEDEIRIALLGSHPYHHPADGWKSDLDQTSTGDIVRFFNENYGTDHAFVLMTGAAPDDALQKLSMLARRESRKIPEAMIRVANAERTLKFASNEPDGAVIFASPVPGVVYRAWYSALMLDRLARRIVPGKPATALIPALDPYYWRLEVAVPAGQFAESVSETTLQEINRLQFSRAKPDDLEAARRESIAYLNSRYVREWFESQGIEAHREEGLQWIESFTADDMRSAARDLLILNHVVAMWSPKPKQTTIQIESLSLSPDAKPTPAGPAVDHSPLHSLNVLPFPAHAHPSKDYSTPERLSSGVWLAASSRFAIFLSGRETSALPDGPRRDGPNGTMWSFNAEADVSTTRAFQKYRADRILVLVPAAAMERARSQWSSFKPNTQDAAAITPQGNVANIDVPALVILKAILDRKLIEAGWWHDASVRIDATHGATLSIEGSPAIEQQIAAWLKAIAAAPLAESDFVWAREVAVHHLDDVLPDVQCLLWQRVPDYILTDIETIAATQLMDVARLYF